MSLNYILDLCAIGVCPITAIVLVVAVSLAAIRWHIHQPRFHSYE